jgi:hypothetical protein
MLSCLGNTFEVYNLIDSSFVTILTPDDGDNELLSPFIRSNNHEAF